ncbi:MAG: EAL domain-containing protein [Desulfarculus sp.]|nr:EAL domain-containing protein [Desulfarculus sp.]
MDDLSLIRLLNVFLDSLEDPAFVCELGRDLQPGQCLALNRAVSRWLGLSSSELYDRLGQMLRQGRPAPPEVAALLTQEGQASLEVEVGDGQGNLLAVSLTCRLLRAGERTYLLCRASLEAPPQGQGLQAHLGERIMDSLQEGVAVSDGQGNLLRVNPALLRFMGLGPEQTREQSLEWLLSRFTGLDFQGQILPALRAKALWRGAASYPLGPFPGALYQVSLSCLLEEAGLISHYVALFSEQSWDCNSQEQLLHLAHYDPLTGLPNRTLFGERLSAGIAHARRRGLGLAVLFLDLDNFKTINDSLGHTLGDDLLNAVARRLLDCVRAEDTVARLGGDEFLLLLQDIGNPTAAAMAGRRVLQALSEPFQIERHELFVSVSVGITLFPHDGEDIETLIKNADMAMYRAKEEGKRGLQLYSPSLNNEVNRRLVMQNNLRRGFTRGEFLVHYQPKLRLSDGQVTGMEALVRWNQPEVGMISPLEFIPLAEESGLILPIGEWVLREACRFTKDLHDAGHGHLSVAVNLSTRQLLWQFDLVDMLQDVLAESELPPEHLELEVTESVIMRNLEASIATMQRIRALGIRISLDDFGTGYSSLFYLKKLPIDAIKIDRAFVRDLPHNREDVAIIQGIIAMATSLNLQVVAEGGETKEQMDFLRSSRCHLMQGFYFSRPVPGEDLDGILRQTNAA